ncbi:hypothetical protein MMC27_004639 [Xylographa pallens]|nr:hypothetical protein [Xylographa pallens]
MSTLTPPPTMRAWTFSKRGNPRGVLTLDTAFPVPPPPSGSNILVRISHASLNPGSLVTMSLFPSFLRGTSIPEMDFSGQVLLAGPAVPSMLAPETPIFGSVSFAAFMRGRGTLAEYAIVPAEFVAVKPTLMSYAEAAGLNSTGQTAMKMMMKAKVKAGDRILINGASGGTGTLAVQTAIALGAEVVGICSGPNAEMVKGLGAFEVVDYRQYQSLEAYLESEYSRRPFDAVLDTMGVQALFEQSPKFLKHEGLFINIGAYEGGLWFTFWCWFKNVILPTILGGIPRRYIMFSTIPEGVVAKLLAKLVEADKLKVVIDSMYNMEDVLDAYDRLMSHRARGKIIIKIQDL